MAINFNTRPYIVLNGKDSRSIKGLIISVLPPIAKPMLRTLVEEIDGRDGDIVTPLGYAAYDKELEIGLSYGYDIDDIISFFSGSGKVVFGSEPDKYYNYAIYNQIDFEKLVRFRKATVVFHVQPFKYSDSESEKTFLFDPEEPEGSLSIRDNGNILSRPKITITGAGTIGLSINEVDILSIDLPDTGDRDQKHALNGEKSCVNAENSFLICRHILRLIHKLCSFFLIGGIGGGAGGVCLDLF